MLHEFISTNHEKLIERCKARAATRFQSIGTPALAGHGVSQFLAQLADILRTAQEGSGLPPAPETAAGPSGIGHASALQGKELRRRGYSIGQVVHEYGDICQSITELAIEQKVEIATAEFRTLNRCLDNAIADAVRAFSRDQQVSVNNRAQVLQTRLDSFQSEHCRLLNTAIEAFAAIRTGSVALSGATATLLEHSLRELRALCDWTIADIRLASATTTLEVT